MAPLPQALRAAAEISCAWNPSLRRYERGLLGDKTEIPVFLYAAS
jgi:hypothetical protein